MFLNHYPVHLFLLLIIFHRCIAIEIHQRLLTKLKHQFLQIEQTGKVPLFRILY